MNNCDHENLVLMESNELDNKVLNTYQCMEYLEPMYEEFFITELSDLKVYSELIGEDSNES